MLDNRESAIRISLGIVIASNSFRPSYHSHLGIYEILPKEEGQHWKCCFPNNFYILWHGKEKGSAKERDRAHSKNLATGPTKTRVGLI